MKNLLLFITLVITLNTALLADKTPMREQELSTENMRTQNRTIAKMFAQEMSKNLPHKIDKYTQLMSVHNKNTTVVYTFEINTGSKSDASVIKEDRSRMKKAIQEGICKSYTKFLDANINISYLYLSAVSKKKLFQFDIAKENCISQIK